MKKIPVLMIEGRTLPEVWEKAVLETWQKGLAIKTEYDKPEDPPSKDCTMVMIIQSPMSEPRIHRAIPGGLEDLEVYRQEVVDGIHDHWVNPEEGKWTYTYHGRLCNFPVGPEKIDQMDYIVKKLSETPYSRRAQAITWNPSLDPTTDDPPCLQRLWLRMVAQDNGEFALDMNTHWRSRDAFKAAFMNIFALTSLQETLAQKISGIRGVPVKVGRYVDIVDSFHIYGSYFAEFQNFLKTVQSRSFEERTWATEFAEPFFKMARDKLAKEVKV